MCIRDSCTLARIHLELSGSSHELITTFRKFGQNGVGQFMDLCLENRLKTADFFLFWNAFWTSYLPENFGKIYGDRHEEYRVNMKKM